MIVIGRLRIHRAYLHPLGFYWARVWTRWRWSLGLGPIVVQWNKSWPAFRRDLETQAKREDAG